MDASVWQVVAHAAHLRRQRGRVPMSADRDAGRASGDASGIAPGARPHAADDARPQPTILIAEADPALYALLHEWLSDCGLRPLRAGAHHGVAIDVVILDVPFPRRGGADIVRRIRASHPRAPIVVLSSAFFAAVTDSGAVARALGVAAVLAKPVQREALLIALGKLFRSLQ